MAIAILILACRIIGACLMAGSILHHGLNGGFEDGYMLSPDGGLFSFLAGGFTMGLLLLFAPEWVPMLGKFLGKNLPTQDNLRSVIREEITAAMAPKDPAVQAPPVVVTAAPAKAV